MISIIGNIGTLIGICIGISTLVLFGYHFEFFEGNGFSKEEPFMLKHQQLITKSLLFFIVIAFLVLVFIPKREEMYAMFVTYKAEQMNYEEYKKIRDEVRLILKGDK